jgi:AcrR family transcriptional regulator
MTAVVAGLGGSPRGRLSGERGNGRHGLTPAGQQRVSGIQRSRLLAAMVEVAVERGVAGVSVAHVVARAGISRRTFYELFEDRDDCFHAAFDLAVARVEEVVLPAYAMRASWREGVRAGLTALLGFLDVEPGLGMVLIVDALNAGPRVLERRAQLLQTLIGIVELGRGEGRSGTEGPPLAAEGVVGGVFSVIHARMLERRAQRGGARGKARPTSLARPTLVELVNPLMGMIVTPYLGAAAARRELRRPVSVPRVPGRSYINPLRDLDMRLTYRTVRTLIAIAEHPGASNRLVAMHAEVADQGQMSKLLTRLEHLGLIQNTGQGPARGEPNAWTLTRRGGEVEQTIRSGSPAFGNHEEGAVK